MKKFILFLSITALLFSCGKEEDVTKEEDKKENKVADKIIGKWFLVAKKDGKQNKKPTSDCEKTSYYEFLNDGTLNKDFFITNSLKNTCESIDGKQTIKWEKKSEGKYLLGDYEATVTFDNDEISFLPSKTSKIVFYFKK